MATEVIEQPLTLDVYGFSGIVTDKNYGARAFQLSGKMWSVVKSLDLKNKGRNIWIYESGDAVFAGVELEETPLNTGLEHRTITLPRYGYYKHVGPYSLIRQAGNTLRQNLIQKELRPMLPYIEIYGHWHSDESKLETELISAIG